MTRPSTQRLAKEYGRMSGLAGHGFMGLDARGPGIPGLPYDEAKTIGLTIAGEIDPRHSPYGKPLTTEEIAAILGVIDNRAKLHRMTRREVVLKPQAFSTWNDAGRRNTAAQHYARNGNQINKAMRSYYAGDLKSPAPYGTNYYSPSGMLAETKGARSKPVWADDLVEVREIGPHVFGTSQRDLDRLRPAPNPTPRPLPPEELADIDAAESLRRANARGFDERGTTQPAPPPDVIMDWLDWIAPRGRR